MEEVYLNQDRRLPYPWALWWGAASVVICVVQRVVSPELNLIGTTVYIDEKENKLCRNMRVLTVWLLALRAYWYVLAYMLVFICFYSQAEYIPSQLTERHEQPRQGKEQ